MLATAGAILIAAAVLFAIFVSWAWLTSSDGEVPERRAWTEEARRADPRFDEWSAFYRENPDASSPFDGKRPLFPRNRTDEGISGDYLAPPKMEATIFLGPFTSFRS